MRRTRKNRSFFIQNYAEHMKNSFRTRIILMFLAAVIGCMAVMIIGCNLFLRPLFINDSKKNMKKYAAEVCAALESEEEPEKVKKLLDQINNAYMIKTMILSREKDLIYNENGDSTTVNSRSMEYMIEWLREYEAEEEITEPFFKERYDENYQIQRLIYVQKTSDYRYVVMNKAIKGIEQDMQLVSIFITLMGVVAAVIGAVSCGFITKPLVSQMEKISRVTQKMAQLDFDEKIAIHSQDEVGILAESIDDMSERLKKCLEELWRDLESRKNLVRNLSHELKTPITTIRGYVENTQIVAADQERIQKYCRIMLEECDEMEHLIGEMIEMSRLESGDSYEMLPFDTEALFKRIRQKNQVQFPHTDFLYQTEPCILYGNAVLLERAVQNYIQNAVKYGAKDSQITIEGKREAQKYLIFVTNEGNTIPQEEQEELWEVFYKSDKSRKRNKSHGIGLAIVRQISQLLNGGVAVQSGDGKTTFLIWIPYDENAKM